MKKVQIEKIIVLLAVTVYLIVSYLFYSRPMTLSKLYPGLTLDKCTEIEGYYQVGVQAEPTQFTIEKDDEKFQSLCSLFYEKHYRRSFSLKDILPGDSGFHQIEPGDFLWDVHFYFEDAESPGETTSVWFRNWFGELDIFLGGRTPRSYHTSEQEAWMKEVLDIIQ